MSYGSLAKAFADYAHKISLDLTEQNVTETANSLKTLMSAPAEDKVLNAHLVENLHTPPVYEAPNPPNII